MTEKTILIDAWNTFVTEGGINQEIHALLEAYPQTKIIVTNANEEEQKEYGMIDLPYELFTLSHNPNKTDAAYFTALLEHYQIAAENVLYIEHTMDAVMSATSVGITSYHYDHEKNDVEGIKTFLDGELHIVQKNEKAEEIIHLEKKLKDTEEIAKKAQYDYIMLKGEFDSYVRRVEGENEENKAIQLVEIMKKMTSIFDQLGQSVHHIPADLEENTWAQGVTLAHDNMVKTLQTMGVSQIPTIGEDPDMELHEPLSVEPTDDVALKGKIIKEFQPGYVYEKNGIKKVIQAAKVIVGQ